MDTFSSLEQLYAVNLRTKKTTDGEDKAERTPDFPVIADRIQDALRLGEDSNIRISPVLIQNAFEAEIAGNADEAFSVAKAIEKEIEEQRKQQVDEEKVLQTLADGSQVLIGQKTGTRYSASGIPLSSGPINTSIYNKVVEGFTGVQQQLAQPTTTIQSSPDVYKQPVLQAPSRLQETIQILEEADRLARSGDKAGAAARLNAVRSQSLFGAPITPGNIMDVLGIESEVPMETEPKTTRPPLEDIIGK